MIKSYLLPVITMEGSTHVAGEEYIHDALLECTESPGTRQLIQDTTVDEDAELISVALEARDATQEEIDRYHAQVVITPPNPDIERAKELLVNSPQVITQTEIWELMRIYGRMLGIPG